MLKDYPLPNDYFAKHMQAEDLLAQNVETLFARYAPKYLEEDNYVNVYFG